MFSKTKDNIKFLESEVYENGEQREWGEERLVRRVKNLEDKVAALMEYHNLVTDSTDRVPAQPPKLIVRKRTKKDTQNDEFDNLSISELFGL